MGGAVQNDWSKQVVDELLQPLTSTCLDLHVGISIILFRRLSGVSHLDEFRAQRPFSAKVF